MCVGAYTVQTDDARTHVACAAYTAPTLACIAEGVDILPPQPTELVAEDIMDSSFVLKWAAKEFREEGSLAEEERDTPPITNFSVNVTLVK